MRRRVNENEGERGVKKNMTACGKGENEVCVRGVAGEMEESEKRIERGRERERERQRNAKTAGRVVDKSETELTKH